MKRCSLTWPHRMDLQAGLLVYFIKHTCVCGATRGHKTKPGQKHATEQLSAAKMRLFPPFGPNRIFCRQEAAHTTTTTTTTMMMMMMHYLDQAQEAEDWSQMGKRKLGGDGKQTRFPSLCGDHVVPEGAWTERGWSRRGRCHRATSPSVREPPRRGTKAPPVCEKEADRCL